MANSIHRNYLKGFYAISLHSPHCRYFSDVLLFYDAGAGVRGVDLRRRRRAGVFGGVFAELFARHGAVVVLPQAQSGAAFP